MLLCFACKFYCTTKQIHLQSVPRFLAAVLVIWNMWFCLCLCVLLLYLKNKKKNVSLINNHWISFLLLFQQLMTCILYSESDTGLKFDSMSRSPGYSITLCIDRCLIIWSQGQQFYEHYLWWHTMKNVQVYERCLGWYVCALCKKWTSLQVLFRVIIYVCTLWKMCTSMSIA